MSFDEALFRTVYANDLYSFLRRSFGVINPGDTFMAALYLRALCNALEQVENGETRRLIITVPPRHLKSQLTSVAFPAWLLGKNPGAKNVCASYSASLAEGIGRQTRDLMRAPFYRATFPATKIDPTKSSVDEFHTLAKGRRIATSVGGTLTGKGGNILIYDDLMKSDDAESLVKRDSCHTSFRNTAASRLNDPRTGAIVIVAQRLHVDDLIGRLLPSGDWDHINLPAVATEPQVLPLGNGAKFNRQVGDLLHEERTDSDELYPSAKGSHVNVGSVTWKGEPQWRGALPDQQLILKPDPAWFSLTAEEEPDCSSAR